MLSRKEVKTSSCMLKYYKHLISEQQLPRVKTPDITATHLVLHIWDRLKTGQESAEGIMSLQF